MSVCGDSEDLAPSNPFLETEEKETPLDVSLQVLQVVHQLQFLIELCSHVWHHYEYFGSYRTLQLAELLTSTISQIKGEK